MKINRVEVSLGEGIETRIRVHEWGSYLGQYCTSISLGLKPREALELLKDDISPWTLLVLIPAWPTLEARLRGGQARARASGKRFVLRFDNVQMHEGEASEG